MTPNFDAEYAAAPAIPARPAPEAMLTMCPRCWATITGSAARVKRKAPVRLTSMSLRQASTGISWVAPRHPTPALFTTASRRPPHSCARAIAAPAVASSVTSPASTVARSSPISSAARARSALVRATSTTRAPAAASSPATARPIPRPAPVTMTTCPRSSPAIPAPPIALRARPRRARPPLPEARSPRVVIGDALGPDAQFLFQLVLDRLRPLDPPDRQIAPDVLDESRVHFFPREGSGPGAPQAGKRLDLLPEARAEGVAAERAPAEVAEEHRLRPQGQEQVDRAGPGCGVELAGRRVREQVVVGDLDELLAELITAEEAPRAVVQDHLLVPGVPMGVEEAEPVASAQVQLVPGAGDQQPAGGHRLGHAIVGLQVLAEDHSRAGDQPARIDQVARPALMHHDLRVLQMPQEDPRAAGVVQVDVRDDDVGDVGRRDA